jgi:hypothetical protein
MGVTPIEHLHSTGPFQGGSGEWGVVEPHGCNPRPDPLLPTPYSLLPPWDFKIQWVFSGHPQSNNGNLLANLDRFLS